MSWVKTRKKDHEVAKDLQAYIEELNCDGDFHHKNTVLRRLNECLYIPRHVSKKSPHGFAQGRDPAIIVRNELHMQVVQRVVASPGLYFYPGEAKTGYAFSCIFNFVNTSQLNPEQHAGFYQWIEEMRLGLPPGGQVYNVF